MNIQKIEEFYLKRLIRITSRKGEFLNFLRPLMTAGLPLMKILITPSAKSVLVPLGLSTEMLAAVAAIKKNIYGQVVLQMLATLINRET